MTEGERAYPPATTPDPAGHRERLLQGLRAALAESAYADVTVADVVAHARTSRRTFYEHFTDKQDCLVALLRDSTRRLVAGVREGVDPGAAWQDQVRQAIEAWVEGVRAEPEVTLSWIRVVPSLGEGARTLMRESMADFAALIGDLSDSPELRRAGITPPSAQETTILLGGLRELIATTVEDGEDVRGIVDTATAVTARVLGPHPETGPGSPGNRPGADAGG